jgi:hypothetical protein
MDKMPETIKIAPRFGGWLSKAEKAQFEEQRSPWVLKNPIIGPYLGQRGGSNVLTVYPSHNHAQVCVGYSWGDTSAGEGNFGSVLTVGQIKNGEIRTQNNEILFLQGPYLVMFVVDEADKPSLWLSPYPEAIPTDNPDLEQKLQQMGCTTGPPSN